MSTEELLLSGLLTYVTHSTVLLACALLATRWLPRDDFRLRRSLWRAALFGGLLTSLLQTALPFEPLSGALRLGRAAPMVSSAPSATPPDLPVSVSNAAPSLPSGVTRSTLVRGALGLWLAGVAFMGLRLGHAFLRVRRGLRDRRDATDAGLRAELSALRAAAGVTMAVRLTCSDRLSVPIAFGLRRGEICVPSRVVHELDTEQQQALLAHELAHLVQRDPLWLAACNAAAILLFFQPLNWLARRRLLSLSEIAADTWAVERIADPLALANCLTRVATWLRPSSAPLLASAMAAGRSDLTQRIARVLDEAPARAAHGALRAGALALLFLAAVTFIAPGISLADKPAHRAASPAPATAAEPTPEAMPAPTAVHPVPRAPAPPHAPLAPTAPAAPRAPLAPSAPAAPDAPAAPRPPARSARVPPAPPAAALEASDDALAAQAAERAQTTAARKQERDAALRAAADLKAQAEQVRRSSADQREAVKRDTAVAAAQLQAQAEQLRLSAADQARTAGAEKAALEKARRELEVSAKELAQEREHLNQERQRLDEEVRRLREERERLRQEPEPER